MSVKMRLPLPTLLLAIAATLAACTASIDKSNSEGAVHGTSVIVARVNGEPVYEADVLRRMRAASAEDFEEVRMDPNRWQMLHDVATETEVMDELLLQTALADGMTVATVEARDLVDRTRKVAGDGFARMLEERGATEDEFREYLVERELIARYKEKLIGQPSATESALQEYYEGHAETFMEPDQVRLEIFTFGISETAAIIHGRWKGGASFDTIANEYEDEGERVGRRTRWMPIDAVPTELQSRVADADVGTILEPAQISGKFYVVRVVDKMKARTRKFEEVKEEIRETILNLRKNKTLDEWYKAASREAKIEYVRD
jgi:parvulin-like peptidyl-prolyl isomerase